MRKIDKFFKRLHYVFHKRLIMLYSIAGVIIFVYIFRIYFRVHFGYLNEIEQHAKSIFPNKGKYPLSDKVANAINNSAEILSQNVNLQIGIITALGIIFTLLFQMRESKKQNFRTNFFEYLKIHRENIQLMETREKKGHDAFIDILNELNYVYSNFPSNTNSYKAYRLEWSYLLVFFGLGKTATPIVEQYIKKKYPNYAYEVAQVITTFNEIKTKFKDEKFQKKIVLFGCNFNFKIDKNRNTSLKCILDGHQSDLGHYYRHLYHTITYVNEFPTLAFFEKYDYVKNVRAQFSNHSIALFLINAYSPLGNNWIREKLITKYDLIKNLPVTLLTQFGKDVKNDFPSIEFEI